MLSSWTQGEGLASLPLMLPPGTKARKPRVFQAPVMSSGTLLSSDSDQTHRVKAIWYPQDRAQAPRCSHSSSTLRSHAAAPALLGSQPGVPPRELQSLNPPLPGSPLPSPAHPSPPSTSAQTVPLPLTIPDHPGWTSQPQHPEPPKTLRETPDTTVNWKGPHEPLQSSVEYLETWETSQLIPMGTSCLLFFGAPHRTGTCKALSNICGALNECDWTQLDPLPTGT